MIDILLTLSPIFLYFGLGMLLKRLNFASADQGDFLLKFVFFITLPALVVLKLSQTPITMDKIYLPFICFAINLSCGLVSFLIFKPARIPDKTMGSILSCTMIANSVFMFPFILTGFGSSGFADSVLFDFGNGLSMSTITYLIAFKYGSKDIGIKDMIRKLSQSVLFWAFMLAIVLNCFSVTLPQPACRFLEGIGLMTSPLMLIALGIFFKLDFSGIGLVSLTVLIRLGTGLIVGSTLAFALGLSGQTLTVVLLCSAAPVGFMALTYSSIAHLDRSFASRTVSFSILLGIIYVPVLMYFFTR